MDSHAALRPSSLATDTANEQLMAAGVRGWLQPDYGELVSGARRGARRRA